MENIVRTVYGAYLQTQQKLGLPIDIKAHSTLNEKFNISANVAIGADDKPSDKYISIGNGGHTTVMGSNNIPYVAPLQHRPTDAALYNHLPFVLRLPNNDLTVQERANYRLRRFETHDTVEYVAYYLKVLDLSETVPQLELRTVVDGVTTSAAFTPTTGNLNPTPPDFTPGQVLQTSGDYIATTAKVPFVMSANDIAEFLNVCNIIYGDENYAMISEMAICSGVDRVVTGLINGVSTGYTEAIAVQVTTFINSFFAANYSNGNISSLFDIGSVEPLLVLA